MDKDFALSQEYYFNIFQYLPNARHRYKAMLNFLKGYVTPGMKILDIGEYNPFTKVMIDEFGWEIDNTEGDLDRFFNVPKWDYDLIICSHVLEHVFNPLHLLLMISLHMKPDGILFISLPVHPYFLGSSPGHFHEMDRYRFKKLVARAGFRIEAWDAFYPHRHWSWRSFTGIRPFLKSFYKTQALVICKKGKGG